MKNCLPDELFNTIPFVYSTDECAAVGIKPFMQEAIYKMPNVQDVVIEREFWATLCDFAERTGLLLEKEEIESGSSITANPTFGRFLRVVGATPLSSVTESGLISFANNGANFVIYSVAPEITTMDFATGDTIAEKHVAPKWFMKTYQKPIINGSLMRLFALRGADAEARMHATAYNNDIKRCCAGKITSGMRKMVEIDVEDVLARISIQQTQTTNTNTVG